jgi:hypothetical protein
VRALAEREEREERMSVRSMALDVGNVERESVQREERKEVPRSDAPHAPDAPRSHDPNEIRPRNKRL